jgi:hypothetical protein
MKGELGVVMTGQEDGWWWRLLLSGRRVDWALQGSPAVHPASEFASKVKQGAVLLVLLSFCYHSVILVGVDIMRCVCCLLQVAMYHKNLARQQQQQAAWLIKRRQENAARRAAGEAASQLSIIIADYIMSIRHLLLPTSH